jgi:hypothetical protein
MKKNIIKQKGGEPYETPFNVLRNSFLTQKESRKANAELLESTDILIRGKRHPLVKTFKDERQRREKPYAFLDRRRNVWERRGHSDFFNEKIDMTQYDTILGSGGFGMIVSGDTTTDVAKLYYLQTSCKDMYNEYNLQLAAFNAVDDFNLTQVTVPQPKKFDTEAIVFSGQKFSCGIEMKRVFPIPLMSRLRNGFVHIILSRSNEEGKEWGKNTREVVSDTNPSRGFLATGLYIRNTILPSLTSKQKGEIKSVNDISFMLGFIVSLLITIAEISPKDVEYGLTMDHNDMLNITILDYGMAKFIDYEDLTISSDDIAQDVYDDAIGYDIYFPSDSKQSEFAPFIGGIRSFAERLAAEDSEKYEKKIAVLKKIINLYNE